MQRLPLLKRHFYYLIGALLILALIVGLWLFLGRLALFETSAYISLFGLDSAKELYQENVLWLSAETKAGQTFVSTYPGLHQISVFLTAPADSPRDYEVVFRLKERCTTAADLRSITANISTGEAGGDRFYRFSFAPIDESAGQPYCFVLEPVIDSEELAPIGVLASRADVYPEGSAFYQTPEKTPESAQPQISNRASLIPSHHIFLPLIPIHQPALNPAQIDVGFQIHYNGRPLEILAVLIRRLVAFKPYVWGQPAFYGVLLVIYLAALGFLIRTRSGGADPKGF